MRTDKPTRILQRPSHKLRWPLSPSAALLAPALSCAWFALARLLMDARVQHRLWSTACKGHCLVGYSAASTSVCFALSSASPTRLLRSLGCYAALSASLTVSFADKCLLGALWLWMLYLFFLKGFFIYHPEAENMPRLCG